jgi:hypothetical protein
VSFDCTTQPRVTELEPVNPQSRYGEPNLSLNLGNTGHSPYTTLRQCLPKPNRCSTSARAYKHTEAFNPRPIWNNFKALFRAKHQADATRTAKRVLDAPQTYNLDKLNDPQTKALLAFWTAWFLLRGVEH